MKHDSKSTKIRKEVLGLYSDSDFDGFDRLEQSLESLLDDLPNRNIERTFSTKVDGNEYKIGIDIAVGGDAVGGRFSTPHKVVIDDEKEVDLNLDTAKDSAKQWRNTIQAAVLQHHRSKHACGIDCKLRNAAENVLDRLKPAQ